ncbi:MAG: Ig-like domain-containing protein [Gemmatimonadales bacterium]
MTRTSVVLALLGFSAAAPLAAQNVTELYVTPDTLRIDPGQRQGLTVQAFDEAGNAILSIKFKIADTLIARVATNGTVTAGRRGRTVVTVQAGQKTQNVVVLVAGGAPAPVPVAAAPATPKPAGGSGGVPTLSAGMSPPPAAVTIARLLAEPTKLVLLANERATLKITAIGSDGSIIGQPELIWRSLQPSVAALIDSAGTVAGMSPGQAVIQVIASSGVSLSVPVSVGITQFALSSDNLLLSPGEADTIRATVPALGNRALDPAGFQWLSGDASVADVSPSGVVRALGAGRTEIVVRGYLQERRIPVLVHQRVAHFVVAPRLTDKIRLPVNSTREFTLIPQTADSLPIEGVPVTWNVTDTAVAAFDVASGVLTARRPGTTQLTFAARGFVAKGWTIEVLPDAVALSRTRLAMHQGEKTTLAANFVDDQGKALGVAAGLEWVTSNAAVARVSADGTVEALAPGRATISVQPRGGQPVQAQVVVTGDLLVSSTRGGKYGLYTLSFNAPETLLPLIADSFANSVDGTWSPDRTRMVFASDRFGSGNFDIFVADADGRNPVRLTTDPAADHQPAWTPDGKRIVFVSGRSGSRQLYVMNADGSEARPLTAIPGGVDQPSVSPDGATVAFAGYPVARDGQSDIYTVALDGGQPVRVTSTADRREDLPFYFANGELGWVERRAGKNDPDRVLRQNGATAVLSTELSISGVTLSADGARLAWVGSRPSAQNKNVLEFTFQWRTLASGAETTVRLLPGERITSPSF